MESYESARIDIGHILSVYSPDMPKRLPVKDIIGGLFRSVGRAVLSWLHYTLVAIAWLGVVPLTACEYIFFSKTHVLTIHLCWQIRRETNESHSLQAQISNNTQTDSLWAQYTQRCNFS